MIRTQINLTESSQKVLKGLSKQLGKSQSEMIRLAIEQFIDTTQVNTRLKRLRAAQGMWKDRTDLPDWTTLRQSLDRDLS